MVPAPAFSAGSAAALTRTEAAGPWRADRRAGHVGRHMAAQTSVPFPPSHINGLSLMPCHLTSLVGSRTTAASAGRRFPRTFRTAPQLLSVERIHDGETLS